MSRSIRGVFFAILVITLTAVPLTSVLAQGNSGNNEDRPTTTDDRQQEKADAQQERLEFTCERVRSKADALYIRYQRNHQTHQFVYQNMVDRITTLLDEIDEAGYDTAEARNQLAQFEAQIQNTNQEMELFGIAMENAKEHACNDDAEGMRGELERAREQLRNIRTEMLQLRSFYQENVKPELIALRQQISNGETDAEETE